MSKKDKILEFGVPRENEERRDGGCGIIFDPKTQKYAVGKLDTQAFWLFSGGLEEGEDPKAGILREVTEESGLYDFSHIEKIDEALCHYHNRLKNVNRLAHATCFLVILKSANTIDRKLEEHEKFDLYWATPKEILENWEARNDEYKGYDHWIYFLKKSVARAIELGYDTTSVISGYRL